LRNAIKYFTDEGGIFITAAGNDGQRDNDITPVYPCDINNDNIICVGATDQRDQLASFSHYGSKVDIAAPGTNIWSTIVSGAVINYFPR
jgi:subtilisin family serine protease